MGRPTSKKRASLKLARAELAHALREKRAEIEDEISVRAFAVAEPSAESPGYVEGLRAAIAAALDTAFDTVESGLERSDHAPAAVLTQARNAARSRVGLEIVLRRYAAGYSALSDFLLREARTLRLPDDHVLNSLRELTGLFDRLVEAVTQEYRAATTSSARPARERQADLLARLLAGELIDHTLFDYDFEGWHLAAIAAGPQGARVLRELAIAVDRRLLIVENGDQPAWAWLGGRRAFGSDYADILFTLRLTKGTRLALGEPASGLRGWRLSHRQAKSAYRAALAWPRPVTRYSEVGLLSAILRDEDLTRFLIDTYLMPLTSGRDGGRALRETLKVYFASGRHISSAAAALGIARQTVTIRLRTIEEKLGSSLDRCGVELEVSLRLAEARSARPDGGSGGHGGQ